MYADARFVVLDPVVLDPVSMSDTEDTWNMKKDCARGEAEGCKTHRGFNFYSIFRQQTHFECPKRS